VAEAPTPNFSSEERARVMAALNAFSLKDCPRCGNSQFGLADGYIQVPISPNPTQMFLGQYVPCVAAYCTRCGFMAMHSAVALGLMQKP